MLRQRLRDLSLLDRGDGRRGQVIVSPRIAPKNGERLLAAKLQIAALMLAALPVLVHGETNRALTPRGNYLLSCGGCHGLDGVSNSRLVPDLKDQVGFFMNLPEGRSYLVRLPNVAFSTTTDQALTELVNYVVFDLGAAAVPKGAKHYTLSEVSQLRRRPLTEVSLAQMRQQMVRVLIDQYHATPDLRRYGGDDYGAAH